jgi:peptidoglycan/xylan/chitin deacetylase (PgdA/CDA1 family)
MGIRIGIGSLKIGQSSFSWSRYWPQPYFKDGTQFDNGKIVIGFDDNWDSVYSNAFPVLQSKGVPAVIYVNGSLVANNPYHGFNTSSWAQLREMYAAGIDIQCHGYTGQQLQLLTDQQLIDEFVNNNTSFVANGLPAPEHIAYSNGVFNDHVLSFVDNYRKSGRTTYNGYANRKDAYYTMPAFDMGMFTLDQLKGFMDIAKANKQAVRLYGHMVGVVDALSITTQLLSDVIDYGKSIGLDFLSNTELYDLMYYIDLRLSKPTATDDQIDIICKNKLHDSDSISIERSDDEGGTYSEIHVLNPLETDYSDIGLTLDKNYYYRARGFKSDHYLPYSRIDNISTAITGVLTSTGNGTGVSKLSLRTYDDVVLTLDGTAKFYTDAAGTLNESASVTVSKSIAYIIYIKCPSGTANLKFSSNKITQILAWDSGTNAASLALNIGLFNFCNYIAIGGLNTVSGDLSKLTSLTHLSIAVGNTVSVDLSSISPTLTYLNLVGSNINTYTSGDWSALVTGTTVKINPNVGYGLSASEIDLLLNDIEDTRPAGSVLTIELMGSNENRKSASDSAVASIIADGGTVTVRSVVFSDDFTGATIDTGKWGETDPNSVLSQNGNLILALPHSADFAEFTNNLKSVSAIVSDIAVLQGHLTWTTDSGSEAIGGLYLWKSNIVFAAITSRSNSGVLRIRVQAPGGNYDLSSTIPKNCDVKIYTDGTSIKFYYWNVNTWTQIGVTQTPTAGLGYPLKAMISGQDNVVFTGANPVLVDNLYFSSYDYSTQYPS